MSDVPPSPLRWLPRIQAAQALGISERTLDRRLQRGQLQRRYDEHGAVLVAIPSVPRTVSVTDVDRALVLAERLEHALAPLVARTAEQEQTIVRQAAVLAVQEQTIDRQMAELAALQAALAAATRPSWWRRLVTRWRGAADA